MNISTDFFLSYVTQGPRYTSYPPATSFTNEIKNNQFLEAIQLSNTHSPNTISLYIHVPFCSQRCYFCGCNTTLLGEINTVEKYFTCLKTEIFTIAKYIDTSRLVTQIHWGGGTPNAVDVRYIKATMEHIRSIFTLHTTCEIAIECNPAYLDFTDIDALTSIGFNRMSLGIQDFHEDVLKAIHRQKSKHEIGAIISYLRNKGFSGINIDLVYGLPLQTRTSFKENLELCIKADPDRIATFSYAHVPWFNAEQNKIKTEDLASNEEKLQMLVDSINMLSASGYDVIGMDHFAKRSDELSIAKQSKTLHRNFQGYCTQKTTGQVYAFGSSAITQVEYAYMQNAKTIHAYMDAISEKGNAIERGYLLSKEELLIKHLINSIMCNGYVSFAEVAKELNTDIESIYQISGFNREKLLPYIQEKLAIFNNDTLTVSEEGMLIVRNIAMLFDPQLEIASNKHSQTI